MHKNRLKFELKERVANERINKAKYLKNTSLRASVDDPLCLYTKLFTK